MKKTLCILFCSAFLLSGCGVKTPPASQQKTSVTTVSPQPIASAIPAQNPETKKLDTEKEKPMNTQTATNSGKSSVGTYATITTGKGDIVIQLDFNSAPLTVKNFVEKSKSNYYNGLTFHRVESWVIQGGDPLGNGTGGGRMPTELSDAKFAEGSVGVARGGDIKVSNDSQFFICTDDCSWLTSQYTNFGKVVKGMDVAKSMKPGDKILSITIN